MKIPESVYRELLAYQAKWLTSWVKANVIDAYILKEDALQIQKLSEITNWVTTQRQPAFKPTDVTRFLTGADPRLIAAAAITNATVVTYEMAPRGTTSLKVKIPEVATHFQVRSMTPVDMLRKSHWVK